MDFWNSRYDRFLFHVRFSGRSPDYSPECNMAIVHACTVAIVHATIFARLQLLGLTVRMFDNIEGVGPRGEAHWYAGAFGSRRSSQCSMYAIASNPAPPLLPLPPGTKSRMRRSAVLNDLGWSLVGWDMRQISI